MAPSSGFSGIPGLQLLPSFEIEPRPEGDTKENYMDEDIAAPNSHKSKPNSHVKDSNDAAIDLETATSTAQPLETEQSQHFPPALVEVLSTVSANIELTNSVNDVLSQPTVSGKLEYSPATSVTSGAGPTIIEEQIVKTDDEEIGQIEERVNAIAKPEGKIDVVRDTEMGASESSICGLNTIEEPQAQAGVIENATERVPDAQPDDHASDTEIAEVKSPAVVESRTDPEDNRYDALMDITHIPRLPADSAMQDQGDMVNGIAATKDRVFFGPELPPGFQRVDPIGVNVENDKEEKAFIEIARANRDNPNAEFAWDSSNDESSESDSSSDTLDNDDDDDAGEENGVLGKRDGVVVKDDEDEVVEVMDARTLAKLLMQAEEGGDNETGSTVTKSVPPRTKNEVAAIRVERPDVEITQAMEILELGRAENIVENQVLIRGLASGSDRVLDIGTVLCLEDRKVVGYISDTLGRVEQPSYVLSFNNKAELDEFGITTGTKIYYPTAHAVSVFTQPLRTVKGSDASNIHDEEVAEHEIEFSDDEQEAEYKKRRKLEKRGIDPDSIPRGNHDQKRGGGRGRGRGRGGPQFQPQQNYVAPQMKYEDDDDVDGPYKPLRRPSNPTTHPIPPRPVLPPRGGAERGRGFRGRGDHGGHGGRGGRGGQDLARQPRGGGSHYNDYNQNQTPSYYSQNPPAPQQWPTNPSPAPSNASFQSSTTYSGWTAPSPAAPSAGWPTGAYVNPAFARNQTTNNPISAPQPYQQPYAAPSGYQGGYHNSQTAGYQNPAYPPAYGGYQNSYNSAYPTGYNAYQNGYSGGGYQSGYGGGYSGGNHNGYNGNYQNNYNAYQAQPGAQQLPPPQAPPPAGSPAQNYSAPPHSYDPKNPYLTR